MTEGNAEIRAAVDSLVATTEMEMSSNLEIEVKMEIGVKEEPPYVAFNTDIKEEIDDMSTEEVECSLVHIKYEPDDKPTDILCEKCNRMFLNSNKLHEHLEESPECKGNFEKPEEAIKGPDIYNSPGLRTMCSKCSSECVYEIQTFKKTLAYEIQTIKKTLAYETQTIKTTLASLVAGMTAINQHLHRMTNTVQPPELFNLLPKFPLDNADQLEQLESNCKTKESVAAQYTRKVASIGGKDVSSCTRKVMKSLFSNISLETYTWCGFKKNKPIKEYTIIRIIVDTVCAAYLGSTNDVVETTIKRWLHYTKDRLRK